MPHLPESVTPDSIQPTARNLWRWLCLIFTGLVVVGSGTYGVDSLLQAGREQRRMELGSKAAKTAPHMLVSRSPGQKEGPTVVGLRPPFHPDADPGKIEAAMVEAYESFSKTLKGRRPNHSGEKDSHKAHDFRLADVVTGEKVELAQFRGKKPVVLVFGSFGCDLLCAQLPSLEEMHRNFKDRAAFFFVYITEAPHKLLPKHPSEDKVSYIKRGLKHFGVTMPCLLADEGGAVEDAYYPFPLRMVIVDQEGRIRLESRKSADLADWLKNNLPAKK